MAEIAGKTAFVFNGGGSLGAIQVGVLRVLLSSGVKPDFVVGASVGAINASYFAGASRLSIRYNLRINKRPREGAWQMQSN